MHTTDKIAEQVLSTQHNKRERESDDAWYTYIRFQKLSSIASRVKFGPSIDQSNVAHNFFIVTRLRGCVQ